MLYGPLDFMYMLWHLINCRIIIIIIIYTKIKIITNNHRHTSLCMIIKILNSYNSSLLDVSCSNMTQVQVYWLQTHLL